MTQQMGWKCNNGKENSTLTLCGVNKNVIVKPSS